MGKHGETQTSILIDLDGGRGILHDQSTHHLRKFVLTLTEVHSIEEELARRCLHQNRVDTEDIFND